MLAFLFDSYGWVKYYVFAVSQRLTRDVVTPTYYVIFTGFTLITSVVSAFIVYYCAA